MQCIGLCEIAASIKGNAIRFLIIIQLSDSDRKSSSLSKLDKHWKSTRTSFVTMSKYNSRQKPCNDFGQCILQAAPVERQDRPIVEAVESSLGLASSTQGKSSLVLSSNEGRALNLS
jgi:hypothetical protein